MGRSISKSLTELVSQLAYSDAIANTVAKAHRDFKRSLVVHTGKEVRESEGGKNIALLASDMSSRLSLTRAEFWAH